MARKSNNTALNNLVMRQNSNLLDNKLTKEVTFVPATTGAVDTHSIATVTGVVSMQIFGVCETTVTNIGGANIEVGTALSTAGLIAQTTATDIVANEIWHDATPDSSIELSSILTQKLVTQNIAYTVSSAAITGGKITFYILWSPVSKDGMVELV